MAKTRAMFICQSCGASQPKWLGRCPSCQAWDSLVEQKPLSTTASAITPVEPVPLNKAGKEQQPRAEIGVSELDRVLGGGLAPGMTIVVGGEPGIGKSTLMLQVAARLSRRGQSVLYVSAEESVQQVGLRADRLDVDGPGVDVLAETTLEPVLELMAKGGYGAIVVDSVQTVRSAEIGGAAGSVSQVRHCAAQLINLAKAGGSALFLVGHVTKEGSLAGPRVLEHMVDTVLHFESESSMRLRLLRAIKNRFGATDEVGVFEMSERGLIPVSDPSAVLLANRPADAPGSVVCAAVSGTRPLLVEVQALVSPSGLAVPRRQALGVDSGRLAMLCAVLSIHSGLDLSGCDVFINVAGGIKLTEPAADLAVAVAMASSLRRKPAPHDAVYFGEIGLAGELRAVGRAQARLAEAARQGFKQAHTAASGKESQHGIKVVRRSNLSMMLESTF